MFVVIMAEKVEKLSDWFKALSYSLRVKIVLLLFEEGEKRVSDIAERLKVRQSSISQHIKILRDTGVVNPRREANNIYYRLSPEFEEFFSALIKLPPIAEG